MSTPYEALIRLYPAFGGHTIRLLDNGLPGQAIPIGKDPDFPWSLISSEINAAALASNAALTDQLATTTQSAKDAQAAQAAAEAVTTQRDATIAQLQARIDALTAPAIEPDLLTQLNAAFEAAIPPEARPAFAEKYAIVRILVQAGQSEMARHVIEQTAVPPELEAAKAQLLAFFDPAV